MDCRTYNCSWLQRHKPVDGWKAVRADLRIKNATEHKCIESYDVKECPLFIPPAGYKKKPQKKSVKKCGMTKSVPIIAYNPKTKERKHYLSMGEATKDIYGFSRQGISHCINGKTHTHKGWFFEKA